MNFSGGGAPILSDDVDSFVPKDTAGNFFSNVEVWANNAVTKSGPRGATWGDGWDASNANRNLGHEVDLQISYKPWKYLAIRPGYSVFAKGPAARRLLPPAPMHFAYLWFVAEF